MGESFFVYILRCSDGSYYVGHTDELMKRIAEHQAGEGCTYTRKRCPVEFLWRAEFATREEAKEMEARIKGWSRAKKEALMKNDWERIKQLGSRSMQGRAPFVKLAALVPQDRVRDCFPTTLRRPKPCPEEAEGYPEGAISKGTDAGNSSWGCELGV
jgi:tRNA/rRNA methyltransferase